MILFVNVLWYLVLINNNVKSKILNLMEDLVLFLMFIGILVKKWKIKEN